MLPTMKLRLRASLTRIGLMWKDLPELSVWVDCLEVDEMDELESDDVLMDAVEMVDAE